MKPDAQRTLREEKWYGSISATETFSNRAMSKRPSDGICVSTLRDENVA
jgi:hypothetical protein